MFARGKVSSVKPAEKWPRMLDSVFMSTPFCRAIVAKEIPPRAGEMSRSDKRGPSAGEAMSQIMEPDAGQSGAIQYAVEHVQYAVRGNRSVRQRREEDVLTGAVVFGLFFLQRVHHVGGDGDLAVGV